MPIHNTRVYVATVEILIPLDDDSPRPTNSALMREDAVRLLLKAMPRDIRYWSVREAHVEARPLIVER